MNEKFAIAAFLSAFAVLFAGTSLAADEPADARSDERSSFVRGKVRVFYSLSGESAVPADDRDGNGTPDRVEDIALQVWAAREFYCGWLGYPDPFASARFGQVDCIEVGIHSRKKLGEKNGVAYRMPQKAKSVREGNPGDRALVLAVANTVDPVRNATPAHEWFHLIQYGATYFSNAWFLEGMARWSEAAWRQDGKPAAGLARPAEWEPDHPKTMELFGMRYDAAAAFWNPLAAAYEERVDSAASTKDLPDSLRALSYSDGSLVLRDPHLPGAALMREILAELAEVDDRAQQEIGYKEWSLANQGAPENNRFLFQAVREVLRKQGMVRD